MAESEADVQQDAALPIAHRKSKKSSQKCRFFNSRNGCRAGSECRFSHDTTFEEKPNEVTTTAGQTAVDGESGRKYKQPLADKRRVISRPIPKAQAEDPRESQLGQIRRRFNPSEEVGSSGTVFKFGLVPSDPDFPFEIDSLSCILTVPFGYPQSGLPSIRVTNQELRRGFQLNIERGFEDLVASSPGATLLGLFNRLDKELENLLSKEMSETVKLVLPPRPKYTESIATEQKVITVSRATVKPVVQEALVFFTSEQKNAASTKRQTEIRQIIARLGRLKGFIKHADESTFTIPFEPTKKTALPDSLRTQQNLRLFVPALYNLHPPQVEFPGNTGDEARRLGKAFQQRAKLHPELTLLAHVNYLSHNVHVMMAEVEQDVPKNVVEIEEPQADVATSSAVDKSLQIDAARPTDKDHVRLIERPPEWAQHSDGQDDYSSDESASTDYESDDEPLESGVIGDATASSTPTIAVERGVQISFPDLGLHCIELLELVTLNIVVKCDRCKETTEFLRLKNNAAADQTGMKDENCKKCSNSLAVGRLYSNVLTN
ncbi:hypothetical protein AAFC00_006330 [Neodothiora populina]|uniref:C3H1-type domain-containing protein n=1 Tax=Neodothiora populina TaxID=2781224 RepID=A0ABR3P577_9PEZI